MNSGRIVRNTAWYGLENAISFASSLITSIVIARTLGPSRMGYIIYVVWIANIAGSLGSVGIPATVRKYMGEYLGAGDQATARKIYWRVLLVQTVLATVITAICMVWVAFKSPVEYRLAAYILIASIWPAMVNFVSAQANVATERLSANLPASAISTAVFFTGTMLTVWLHVGVIGIALAMFAMRAVDFLVRLIPTAYEIYRWPVASDSGLPKELSRRMIFFAWQSLASMLLTLIVWDRSELFLLKYLSSDIRQIAFYSVAFNFAERLLVFPSVFASATGVTIYAQYGRDRSRLPGMVSSAARYLGLFSIPLHFVAAALGGAIVVTLNGSQYAGAIAVAMVSPLFCLPKAFLGPIQNLFESTEQQKYFIWSTVVASVVDLGVAAALIPRYGALGACIGSGAAQTLAISTLWVVGIRQYKIRVPWAFLGKVTAIGAVSAAVAYVPVTFLSPQWALVCGGLAAGIVCILGLRLSGCMEPEDWHRLRIVLETCPRCVSVPATRMLLFLGTPLILPPAPADDATPFPSV